VSHTIIHEKGWFLVWSTVVDAPVTCAMTREELVEWWRGEHGRQGVADLGPRIERAAAHGTSAWPARRSAEDAVAGNRAGPRDRCVSLAAVFDRAVADRGDPECPGTRLPGSGGGPREARL
jgi:hypothetical protein